MEKFELQSPIAVANFIIEVANEKENPVTNLKLQKVLFFLQGYCLAEYNSPLIDGNFSKWKFGPVEEDIYREFKYYGPTPITSKSVYFDEEKIEFCSEKIQLSNNFKEELQKIISKIISYEAWRLVDLTHSHSSWKNYQNEIIAQTVMKYTNTEILDCFNSCRAKLGV